MPSVSPSPFLEELLTRWTDRRSQVRHEVNALLDQLANGRQTLDDHWSVRRQERSASFQQYEAENAAIGARWTERLRRIDEWQGRLRKAEEECGRAEATVRAVGFFERAQDLSVRLGARLSARIGRLEESELQAHEALEKWQLLLSQKETDLQGFKQKEKGSPRPLLVSRARKQPELQFVAQQVAAEQTFSLLLQGIRRTVNHSLGRIYKAARLLEMHARTNETLFAANQRQAQHELKEPQNQLFALRERVLSDALLYETCRKKLRWIQETVRSIRCLEDVYAPPEPFWKKLFRHPTGPTKSH